MGNWMAGAIGIGSAAVALVFTGLGLYYSGQALFCSTHLAASPLPSRHYQKHTLFWSRWVMTSGFLWRQAIAAVASIYLFGWWFTTPDPLWLVAWITLGLAGIVVVDVYSYARVRLELEQQGYWMQARNDLGEL